MNMWPKDKILKQGILGAYKKGSIPLLVEFYFLNFSLK